LQIHNSDRIARLWGVMLGCVCVTMMGEDIFHNDTHASVGTKQHQATAELVTTDGKLKRRLKHITEL
jgi:hypothetical protein